jgi:HAD superfamily hydrolase (TIGR01484 family)
MPKFLLCTDLDRTLLPNGPQPESAFARERFSAFIAQDNVTLAFVSGRDRKLVQQAITNYCLPEPDFVITDVGTSIYDLRNGKWTVWSQWHDEIAPDWNGQNHNFLCDLLTDIDALRLQEHEKQNTYKLSYYAPLYIDRTELDRRIQQLLDAHNINASLIWSVDEPAGVGLLDILPKRATKLHAVELLMSSLAFPLQQTLFAGDSGNDLAVLASRIPAVLVAYAMPDVKQAAVNAAADNRHSDALYIAQGGYLGMNGNYSAGILEGIAHYHPNLGKIIEQTATT